MPVDVNDLMTFMSDLSKDNNLRVTVKESLRGGIIAGVITALGGLVAGPPGFAIGGAVGGTTAYCLARGKFRSAAEVIMDMDEKEKLVLYNDAMKILSKFDVTDLVMLGCLIQGNPQLSSQLLSVVKDHLTKNLHMVILD